MPNKNYIRGRAWEYEVMKFALEAGASMVFRTAGSHGPYDIIAFYPETRIVNLTQCKTKINKVRTGVKQSEEIKLDGLWTIKCSKATKYIRRRK